jgi:hypothetical protein
MADRQQDTCVGTPLTNYPMVRRVLLIVSSSLLLAAGLGSAWWAFGRDLAHHIGPSEKRLSATGLYSDISARAIAQNVMPFEPQHALWSDGAKKRRYVFLPAGSQIDTTDPDRWNLPAGTRLWKEFERDGVVVETRMLLKTGPAAGDWDMAAYVWRTDRSDADKIAFPRKNANGTRHDVPGPRNCVTCHGDGQERRPLGFTAVQLPWEHASLVSVTSLAAAGRLSAPPASAHAIAGSPVARAALGYLHANCGSCHYKGTTAVPSRVTLWLSLTTQTMQSPETSDAYRTGILVPPLVAGLGATVRIAPGNPAASLVWRRMGVRDDSGWQMPPIATEEVDEAGLAVVRHWIEELPTPESLSPSAN